MRITVLGTVGLTHHSEDVLGAIGPLQRGLLAALALAEGRTVDRDRLIAWLWGDELPSSPHNALNLHVSRLRRRLDAAGTDVTVRVDGGGYRLISPDVETDVLLARASGAAAAAARSAGEPDVALRRYEDALRWWSADPLAGIPQTEAVRARVTALREEHLRLRCDRLECAMEAGRGDAFLPELTVLVDERPFDEWVRALQVRALHLAGRPADALAAFARARRLLVAELGVEPGGRLRAAQDDVLRGGESTPPRPRSLPAPTTGVRRLPAPAAESTGRDSTAAPEPWPPTASWTWTRAGAARVRIVQTQGYRPLDAA